MNVRTELAGFRRRLHSRDLLVGALLTIPDPAVASILGRSGFDFVVVDAEHGAFTLTTMRACLDALAAGPAATVARLAGHDPVPIKQALDLGFDAVQIPSVSTAEEAAAAVRASRLAPGGARGLGLGRASGYGSDLGRYLRESDRSTGVLVMIEDVTGVENAAPIAAVDGVDGIVIGPLDLSASLAVTGEMTHPLVVEATARVVAAALAAGVAVGTACTPADAPAHAADGMRILVTFVDGLGLSAAARASVEHVRGRAKESPG